MRARGGAVRPDAAHRAHPPTGPELPQLPDVGAPQGTAVVAGPGAQFATYATPAMVVEVGGDLTFVNGDANRDDVVAKTAIGPDDQPWYANAPAGRCPLFWSRLIGLGEQTPVLGTENLVSGSSYEFFCTLHPSMTGTLIVA